MKKNYLAKSTKITADNSKLYQEATSILGPNRVKMVRGNFNFSGFLFTRG